MKNRRIIELTVPIMVTPPGFFPSTEVTIMTHEESAKKRTKDYNFPEGFFPDNKFGAHEYIRLNAHSGTHLDAPWHYGPMSMGKPAKTIDEIPLEWCYSDGVVLDFTHIKTGERILASQVIEALNKIKYKLKPYDIVLIRTDASKHYLEPDYDNLHPGMSREATLWLIQQSIKVMGIDAKGWDRPREVMLEEARRGNKDQFWESHFAGREMEYCHIENLVNLDAIPKPYGFEVAVFPIKISRGSGGWVRAVAILEE